MNNSIFRKEALDRISSPEKIDNAVTVVPLYGWLVLLGLCIGIGALTVWMITGNIPEKVRGEGILMHSEGVRQITAPANNKIENIFFKEGNSVHKGQVIAQLEATDLLNELNMQRDKRAELQKSLDQKTQYYSGDSALRNRSTQQKQEANRKYITDQRTRETTLQKTLEKQELLFKDGLITASQLESTRNELTSVQQSIKQAQQDMLDSGISLNEITESGRRTIEELRLQISELDHTINQLEQNYKMHTEVVATVSGTILEIPVAVGDYVSAGTPVATIEETGSNVKDLEAVLYIDSKQAKKIKPGQRVAISPSSIKQEEYGTINGLITSVSPYPSSRGRMIRMLGSETLTATLLQQNVPVEVHADLIPDERTPSGYKWSSSKGPDVHIESGFLCSAMVVVRDEHPISMVIPAVKKTLLGIGD